MNLSDVDVLSHDVWLAGVPHDQLTRLRHEAPVFKHHMPEGVNDHVSDRPSRDWVWLLTGHAEVREVNRDVERFSSEAMGVQLWDDPGSETAKTMISVDPPDHTRLRLLVNRGFTPRMIDRFTEHFGEVTATIIDQVIGRNEPFDFVTEVAAELPLVAISELLGVPVEDRRNIFDWTNRMIGGTDPEYDLGPDAATLSAIALYQYASELAEDRRQNPRDDIITKLITEVDGDALGAHEFELFVLMLSVAGSETTRNAITHGLMALLDHPDQLAMLRDDLDTHLDTAVDEMIRWATPVNIFRRTAMVDCEIGGQAIAEGDAIVLCYPSANRDERVFDDPFTFDITRTPNDHVAFGGGGPHFCLGANLARLEMRIMFSELLNRTSDIEAMGPAERLRSNFLNGIKHLPVRVTAT